MVKLAAVLFTVQTTYLYQLSLVQYLAVPDKFRRSC